MSITLDTLDLRPGSVKKYESTFYQSHGNSYGWTTLKGQWRTEIGKLDQVWRLWETPNTEAVPDPLEHEWIVRSSRRHMIPAAFTPDPIEINPSNLIEIRIYRYDRNRIEKVIDKWALRIRDRIKLSPLMFCGYTDTDPISDWIHLWPYTDMNQRTKIRTEAIESGVWPPGAFEGLVDQESIILKSILIE